LKGIDVFLPDMTPAGESNLVAGDAARLHNLLHNVDSQDLRLSPLT
jgi:hypothetical protein